MNVPVQLQRMPRRKRPMKPATQRALFFVAVVLACLLAAGSWTWAIARSLPL